VSERTAFSWAKDTKVRREVEACRRRVVNQAIGRLTGMTTKAVDGITNLAQEADSESVQLRAWRAILADQMAVAKFSDLEYRMTEIEEQVRDRTGHTAHPG
jgi:chorismate mutase